MADVLLISTPFKGLLREPMGLYNLAGVLNSGGVSTALQDFNVELPTRSSFHRYLKDLKPKIVGVTGYTFNFSVAREILREVKRVAPNVTTVMGGVHASALPGRILENTHSLDFIVVGEGELTFLELCRRVLDGVDKRHIKGLAHRSGDKVAVNPPRELINDLDELPVPDRGLLPFDKYPVAAVQTSRGCPYNCIFCNINRFYGRRIRLREPRRVAEECQTLTEKYDRDKIFFFGDSFTFRSDWTEDFCDEVVRRGLKFTWGCETRVDNVTLPLLRKMRRAGCTEIQFGIEYGDEEILKRLGKDITLGTVGDAVRWAKKAGLFVGAFFNFNVPGEDQDTMERTFDLIQKTPVDAIEVNLLTPYPGTALWEDPGRFGMRIIDNDFDYYTTKKYVMENLQFPRDRFVPAFKSLLKRLNLVPTAEYYPEIYDFLKKDIKPRAWGERSGLGGLLRF
jgi:radical SAM superfamily enzyme YgiQ (UPF0313 family)